MAATVELKELIEHCVHFGHRTCFWEPKMAPYIYGKKSKDLHIINLLKTRPLLQKALQEIESIAANNGKILFVSTKRVAQEAIEQSAKRCEMPYVSKRWPGGMLTNFKTILRSVKKMNELEAYVQTKEFSVMKKKERLSAQRDLGKLQASFNGIRHMNSLPDMIFVIDVGHEHIAVREAKKLGIPVVGIVDTNCSPEDIDYVVPGNDDSHKAIDLYTRLVADTIDVAREKIREKIRAAEVKMEGKTKVKVVKKSTSTSDDQSDSAANEPADAAPVVEADTKSEASTDKKSDEIKIIRVAAKKAPSKKEETSKAEKPAKSSTGTTKKVAKKTAAKSVQKTDKVKPSTKSAEDKPKEAKKATAIKVKAAEKTEPVKAKKTTTKVAASKGKTTDKAGSAQSNKSTTSAAKKD